MNTIATNEWKLLTNEINRELQKVHILTYNRIYTYDNFRLLSAIFLEQRPFV